MLTKAESSGVKSIRLHDGRRLAYQDMGDPLGRPVIFCHGWGDSRLMRHPDERLTANLGVRLITIDRPGIGFSDFQIGRTLLDWPDDVRQLADELGLERFALLGHSGGGPHALACALCYPERLSRVGIASGLAPLDHPGGSNGLPLWMQAGYLFFRRYPWTTRLFIPPLPGRFLYWVERRVMRALELAYPPGDRVVLAQPGVRDMFMTSGGEAVRQGTRGLAHDLGLIVGQPWGFQPRDIRLRVFLWYGDDDDTVPLQMGRYLAGQLNGSRLHEYPGEGHLLFINHWGELLKTLVEE